MRVSREIVQGWRRWRGELAATKARKRVRAVTAALLFGGALRPEKTIDGRENQEKTEGEDGGPGEPVPDGPINHGYRGIGGIVPHNHGDIFTPADRGSQPILKMDEAIVGLKFDDGHIAGCRK